MDMKISKNERGFFVTKYFSVEAQRECTATAYSEKAIIDAANICSSAIPNFDNEFGLALSYSNEAAFLRYLDQLDFQNYLLDMYKEAVGKEFIFLPKEYRSPYAEVRDHTEQLETKLKIVLSYLSNSDNVDALFITKKDFDVYKGAQDHRALTAIKSFYVQALKQAR